MISIDNNQNYLIVTLVGDKTDSVLQKIIKLIYSCNCTVIKSRISTMNGSLVGSLNLSGNWSAIAKIEVALSKLEIKNNIKIYTKRSDAEPMWDLKIPYQMTAVTLAGTNIVPEIINFFHKYQIDIDELKIDNHITNNIKNMISITVNINMELDTHIPTLRESFMELCSDINLDAGLEPLTYVQ